MVAPGAGIVVEGEVVVITVAIVDGPLDPVTIGDDVDGLVVGLGMTLLDVESSIEFDVKVTPAEAVSVRA